MPSDPLIFMYEDLGLCKRLYVFQVEVADQKFSVGPVFPNQVLKARMKSTRVDSSFLYF